MSNVAVLGEKELIYGFRFLGMECFYVDSVETGRRAIDKIFSGDYKVIFMLERWVEKLKKELIRLEDKSVPVLVPIKDSLVDYNLINKYLAQASVAASGVDLTKKG